MTARLLAPWLGLALVVAVALAVVVARSGASDDPEDRAHRLGRQIACPVCTGESVAESNAPEARAIRAEIRELITAGRSDAEIIEVQVDRYGERVRLRPDSDGIGLLAWTLPLGVVVLGGAGIVIALRRWSAEPRLAPSVDDEAIVRRARGRRDG